MNNKILKNEIKSNIKEIYYRAIIVGKLITRYFLCIRKRTPNVSFPEYDNYWNEFWEKRDMFRKDLVFVENDMPITTTFTPFDMKNETVKILADKISKYNFKSVLEVGSGAGLNLVLLAPLFPNVEFVGLEPTDSGVRVSKNFINSPPPQFEKANKLGKLTNIQIVKGSILDKQSLKQLNGLETDFVFTTAVLEQLNNYLDVVFENIFALSNGHFLFSEEWLEANYLIENYKVLVDNDYFRTSWNYLNNFNNEIEVLERFIPAFQPRWLKYGVVFARKK
jgi:SAM-dependent methyltransferase